VPPGPASGPFPHRRRCPPAWPLPPEPARRPAGHVDTWVTRDDTGRRRHHRVVAVRSWPKADVPAETFDVGGGPRLVLISCGGSFDEAMRRYRDNVVVHAVPRAT
jgi:hypothetical protein